jgi:hypothetical protein
MFTQVWNKYLPIIKILMKRSTSGHQTLDMNQTDFQRAAGGRKVKFTFTVALHKGRIQNITNPPPLAKDLAVILQEDDMTRQLVRQHDFEFSMNSGFKLLIKNNTPPPEPEKDSTAEVSIEEEKLEAPAR